MSTRSTLLRTRLLLALGVAAVVAGCGVKGPPELPEGRADSFPRTYPQGAVPHDTRQENIFVDRRR
jgi:predicted small lipoprotein YifL